MSNSSDQGDWVSSFIDSIVNDKSLSQVADSIALAFSPSPGQESSNSSYFGSNYDGSGFNGVGSSKYDQPAQESPSFFDRLKGGAEKAWEKDPLEVLKFGASAIGGTLAAERQRKMQQAQIDAYNARLDEERNARAAYNASLAGQPSAPYTAPRRSLTTNSGARVFNDNGTLKRY